MMTDLLSKLHQTTMRLYINEYARIAAREAITELESLTVERDRLAKALELAANRLYEEGAPHSYVDDAREVLAGRDPY